MPMMFFHFLKIIFDISTSKRSKKYKPHSILTKKKIQNLAKHNAKQSLQTKAGPVFKTCQILLKKEINTRKCGDQITKLPATPNKSMRTINFPLIINLRLLKHSHPSTCIFNGKKLKRNMLVVQV